LKHKVFYETNIKKSNSPIFKENCNSIGQFVLSKGKLNREKQKYSSLAHKPHKSKHHIRVASVTVQDASQYKHSSDHKIIQLQARDKNNLDLNLVQDPYLELRKNGSTLSNQAPTFAPEYRSSSRGTASYIRYLQS